MQIWKGRIFLNPPYGEAGLGFIERAQKIIASMENTCSGWPCDIVRELAVRIAGLEIKYADKQIQCDTQCGERKDLSGTESQILSESN